VYNLLVVTVEIIIVGNEILLGLVQDSNSNYLCRVVRGAGGRVRHIAVVRDEVDSIADEIQASVARRADLVFTCGGLGPTDDDLTLAAVARASGKDLELNAQAREMVERRYRELARAGFVASGQMSQARLKMARLPESARVIENPVGAAPAAAVEIEASLVVSLPGVPAEMKAIVEGPLYGLLAGLFGRGSYREREVKVRCGDESALAPALRKVAAAHPEVYIKSRASHFGPDLVFRILISASATTAEEADRLIERAAADFSRALDEAGIKEKDE
jgi:molybdenum cofactor synthesis domain-containing protein